MTSIAVGRDHQTIDEGPRIFRRMWRSGLLANGDMEALANLPWRRTVINARERIPPQDGFCLLASGFAVRKRTDAISQGQMTAVVLPGDPCWYTFLTGAPPTTELRAITTCSLMQISLDDFLTLAEERTEVLATLLSHMAVEAATAEELLLSVSKRTALVRTAHFLCELEFRLHRMGLSSQSHYLLHLTQAEIGKYLGLSAVHVNRTLQELRRRGLLRTNGTHVALDHGGMRDLADFSPAYLIDAARRERPVHSIA